MNEKYIAEYQQGFMDKCASAGLTQEQSEELYKQAGLFSFVPKVFNKVKGWFGKGEAPASKWDTAKKIGRGLGAAGGAAVTGSYLYDTFVGGGGQPQQPGMQGPQGPQLPQRDYGQAKLNVEGMGGITPYLT